MDNPEPSGHQRFVVSESLSHYTDPHTVEETTIARWQRLIEVERAIDCKILTARSILTAPTRIVANDQVWEVRPVHADEVIVIPDWVNARLDRFKRAGMPICQVIYGDEIFRLPRFQASSAAEPTEKALPEARSQRVSFWQAFGRTLLGSFGYSPSNAGRAAEQVWAAPSPWKRLDPILIVVVPTSPGRGVWIEVAAWFHETMREQASLGPTRLPRPM